MRRARIIGILQEVGIRARERWEYLFRTFGILGNAFVRGRHSFVFDWMPMIVRRMPVSSRFNLLRAGLNLCYRRPLAWSWPLNMQVELTSYCNLRCQVCPVGTGDLKRGPMAIDVDVFDRLMREVGPYLLTLSLWAWGEPLLHPQLLSILSIAKRYPVSTLVSTNGQNLNQVPVLDAIQKAPPTYLIVATDGLCDETNSQYRRGARMAPLLEGVRALSEWKKRTGSRLPVLHCRFLAMKHNEHELPGLKDFANTHGFDMVSVRGLSIIDSSEDIHKKLLAGSERLRPYAYQDGRRQRRNDFVCQHAFSFPTVFADGTVVACEQDFNGAHSYGKLSKERSFKDIWFGREATKIRRNIRDNPSGYSFCRRCPYADRPISSCSLEAHYLQPIKV